MVGKEFQQWEAEQKKSICQQIKTLMHSIWNTCILNEVKHRYSYVSLLSVIAGIFMELRGRPTLEIKHVNNYDSDKLNLEKL